MRTITLLLLLACLSSSALVVAQEEAEPATTIQVTDAPQDQAVQRRLEAIIAAIDGLETVEVSVTAGVVTLSGNVPGSRAARDLMTLASHAEGVVHVQNRLNEDVDVSSRVRPVTLKLRELGVDALETLPIALVALATLVFFWFLGRWAGNRGSWLKHIGLTELGSMLGRRVIRLLITLMGFIIALEILDATALVSALLGVAGVVGIAVGFAFRNIVENYLAGVLLSARNPFSIGDLIQVGATHEFQGSVVRLTSRDTVLMTPEGNHLRIPNSVIITSSMTNFSRNPLRLFNFNIGVSVDFDLVAARDLGVRTLRAMKATLDEPRPQVLITELGDSTVRLSFSAWIDQSQTDFLRARSEAIRQVKTAFDAAGIEMPEPIYRIHLHDSSLRRNEPGKSPAAAPEVASETRHDDITEDVSTDDAIEKQVAEDLRHSSEENLLQKK